MSNLKVLLSTGFGLLAISVALAAGPTLPGRALSDKEASAVTADIAAMRSAKLPDLAKLASRLMAAGEIRAALPDDQWLAGAEKAGDTPYAYTLPNPSAPKSPIAIVLAPRFFDATPKAQTSLLIHEMGHWRAFVATGASTEFDGYKLEYDTYRKVGLSESDGLTYFAMLDGVVQYVVPKLPSYGKQADIKAYEASSP